MVRSQRFGPMAQRRFLMAGMTKHYLDDLTPLPIKRNGEFRKFFCVYLVGFLLQAAEGEQFYLHLKEKFQGGMKYKEIPDFNNFSNRKRGKILKGHTEYILKNFSSNLKSFAKMKFDAETVNPRWFREFTLNNPKIFKDVARIIQPGSKK